MHLPGSHFPAPLRKHLAQFSEQAVQIPGVETTV